MLFRDAAAIENFRRIDTMIFDKTGTLTEGKPVFDTVVPVQGQPESEVLRLAASLDQGSEHPLAHAIVEAARKQGLKLSKAEEFESSSGIGVCGIVEGRRLALGNTALMHQEGVDVSSLTSAAEQQRQKAASVRDESLFGVRYYECAATAGKRVNRDKCGDEEWESAA